MGPNGSGKSTLSNVLMGKPGYEVTGGSVTLDGVDLLALATWERAQAGLYLAMQYPTEVPGVRMSDVLEEAFVASGPGPGATVARLDGRRGGPHRLRPRVPGPPAQRRPLRRREEAQRDGAARPCCEPRIAILDELDSGLDVDALRAVSRRIEEATKVGLRRR